MQSYVSKVLKNSTDADALLGIGEYITLNGFGAFTLNHHIEIGVWYSIFEFFLFDAPLDE